MPFARNKLKDLLVGNVKNTQFFCNIAFEDEKIIGGLCAGIRSYIHSYDVFASDHFLFIVPEKRSILLATDLVAGYVDWARERKVREVLLSNFTGIKDEGFGKLAGRLGFTAVGSFHSMHCVIHHL